MADSRDRSALRKLVDEVVAGLGSLTHRELNPAFQQLGMPPVPDDAGSKRERIELSLGQVPEAELPQVAQRILERSPVHVSPSRRYQLEDLLWAEDAPPEIPKKARRELARALDLSELAQHHDRFLRLLDRFWIAEDSGFSFKELEGLLVNGTRPVTLRDRIERHVFRNPGDWSTEDLFDNLGVFEAGDARLARFLEGLVSADVLLDEHLQEKTVGTINGHLRAVGVELRVTGNDGGYPVFTVVPTRLHGSRRPKNIIFASFTKPDIRFRSSVDNDIEIVGGNPDDTLVYDREVPIEGLRWRDLHAWWQDAREISSETEARGALYQRLLKSLPDNSEGQKNLFIAYHQILGPAPGDPAPCPKCGCTGTTGPSRSAAPRPCCAPAWIFSCCCLTGSASSWRSTGPSTTPATAAARRIRASTRTWSPLTEISSSGGTKCSASATTNSSISMPPRPFCGSSSRTCSAASG
ncbi:hypothetical protein AB0D89_33065 [Streptomyces luteogriseus]|uniref:AbiJ-related protein n=1 Tax=Streptomyces luteogriseus TaxID=68233 RepID=UPI0034026EB6